jgi:two-component system cell cycle sensor histidine kinase/response regulator CckA
MVVEDESIIALDIKISLQSLGYEVAYMASSGEEALRKAPEVKPDLMLMDIRLRGGMDGVETALQVGERIDVPVIFLSGHTDLDTLERVKMTQPFGYLSKPFTKKDLRTTIEVALQKHEMEKQLREREQWLSTTLRSIGDAVIATDAEGRILFMNPVAQVLTGWAEADALCCDLLEIFRLVDADGKELAEHPLRMAQASKAVVELPDNVSLVSKNGQAIPIEDSAAPILGQNGDLTGVVVVFRDATARLALEAARHRKGEGFRLSRNGETGRIAAGIAHDFNNKLTVIMGMSELLAGGVRGNPELLDLANEIRRVCDDSIALTKRLLALGRNDGSNEALNYNLNGVVRKLEKIVRPILGEGIEVVSTLDPALEEIETSPGYLEQLIMNLVLSARDDMPRGGVLRIGTSLEDLPEAHPSLAYPFEPGRYAILKVCHSSSAPGSSVSTAMNPSLAMVYRTVKHNGGNIRVEMGPAMTKNVFVYLPVEASGRVVPILS